MAEDKKNLPKTKAGHNLILEDRNRLTVTGVSDIERFDEEEVVVATELGQLTIKGQGLHLNKIDVEDGELSVEGELDSLAYADRQDRVQGGFFARLFR